MRPRVLALLAIAVALAGSARGEDPRAEIDQYHAERQRAAADMASSREAALHDLRERYARQAQLDAIELKRRDNALRETLLANEATEQRLWALLAAAALAAAAMVLRLVQRLRRSGRGLSEHQRSLRRHSEQDPLTGLANRRLLQSILTASPAPFDGALLLLDIDRFKAVNDGHGHAAGDRVLQDMAQRLQDTLGDRGRLARWGGEEFLVHAPQLDDERLQELAQQMLHAVAERDFDTPAGAPLRITASVGYARFPLAGGLLPVTWERALNLVDMALYLAKGQGRNQAFGIRSVDAADDAGLRAVEADFELAVQQGRVALTRLEGPSLTPQAERTLTL